jgi:arabinan endo-1,5-alpha-L-arabinosidase
MKKMMKITAILSTLFLLSGLWSCSKKGDDTKPIVNPPVVVETPFDINSIKDTYGEIANPTNSSKWGPYNVHDPSIVKGDDGYYYCYNTDVAYGHEVKAGIQIRKSKDLVDWRFVGWVFNGLPAKGRAFIKQNLSAACTDAFNSLWAPYIMKVGDEYRLYYSLSSNCPRLSVIGLATATTPIGPWTEKDLVVTSPSTQINNSVQTNAIDPTVVVTPRGEHWMYYGSAWDGIYILKLNPATGLAATGGSKGKRIAQRGFTNNVINGNIEGPEIIYNATLNKYFLFIAYDWLQTKYNVVVGRSDSPEGPFLDYLGRDMNVAEDNVPMILAPYKFDTHAGWQGVSHCAIIKDDAGQYYMAHQGRPVVDSYYMILHVRKMFWTQDGWPVVSPERYANVPQTAITSNELAGQWDQIVLGYTVVPGFANEQTSPNLQVSVAITLDVAGTINGNAANTWTFDAPNLTLSWNNGAFIDKVIVSRERDWENKIASTLVFTGLNGGGTAIWGRKKTAN